MKERREEAKEIERQGGRERMSGRRIKTAKSSIKRTPSRARAEKNNTVRGKIVKWEEKN